MATRRVSVQIGHPTVQIGHPTVCGRSVAESVIEHTRFSEHTNTHAYADGISCTGP